MALLDRLIAAGVGWVPKPIVRKVASRYVAGKTLDAAVRRARSLMAEGCRVTFDLLGEFVTRDAQADEAVGEYTRVLERIHQEALDGNVSVKLTSFGLLMDEEKAYARLRSVVGRARELGNAVRIDMEDSSCTDATFRLYRRLRDEGFKNVGLVVQAYLRRTLDDLAALAELTPSYRLCKGIYRESAEIAFKDAEEIRAGFRSAMRSIVSGGSFLGIATHDEMLVADARGLLRDQELPRERYEFQMLLGVADPLRRTLVAEGHPLRVYVPYGRDWYGYCVRRLKENPRIGRHVFLAMFKQRS